MKKPSFQNHFENFSQLEALRAIIRLSPDIFFVQKVREKQGNWVFSQLQSKWTGTALIKTYLASGQLRVQVGGVPVLPGFGEPPIFDAHD